MIILPKIDIFPLTPPHDADSLQVSWSQPELEGEGQQIKEEG